MWKYLMVTLVVLCAWPMVGFAQVETQPVEANKVVIEDERPGAVKGVTISVRSAGVEAELIPKWFEVGVEGERWPGR